MNSYGMKREKMKTSFGAMAAILFIVACAVNAQQKPTVLRVGYFPNITHAQALVGRANGQFEKALGAGVQVQWKAFNAGPSAIEALFANAIDLTYVGPNRCDFQGKKVATPQLGNTQDVALRSWMRANGLKAREKGGDVQVIPISNPDQLTLFLKGQLDAAWAPEPWAARLVHEGGGRIFLDERDLWPDHQFVITNLIVNPKFLKDHPDVVKGFLRTHVELTEWIKKNPAQAKQVLNQQIQKETGKPLPQEVLDDAFSRMQVTYDPIRSSLLKSTQQAFDEGFLGRTKPDLSGLYDLTLLNEVLREKKARPVQ